MRTGDTIRQIALEDPAWIGGWALALSPDLPVVFYRHDGKDDPDEWQPGAHLAVLIEDGRALAWPVDVDGWANLREIGWERAAALLADGRRN